VLEMKLIFIAYRHSNNDLKRLPNDVFAFLIKKNSFRDFTCVVEYEFMATRKSTVDRQLNQEKKYRFIDLLTE